MKTKLFLLSMLAVATISSCDKNVSSSSVNGEIISTKIILETSEYGSRSIEGAYVGAPAFEKSKMLVRKYDATAATGNEVGSPLDIDLTSEKVINLASTVKSIKVLANYDGYTEDLTDNVNTRQEKSKVQIEGTGDINANEGSATVTVDVAPEMARIEIVSKASMAVTPAIARTNIKVLAIYINNTKLTRTGTIDKTIGDAIAWDDIYKVSLGTKYALFDVPSELETNWPLVGTAIFGADKAVGFNIFPQTGGATEIEAVKNHPHIIFKVRYDEEGGIQTGYLNITNFKNGADFVTDFVAGSVYQFDIADILNLIEAGAEITPDPDPETTNIAIALTVKNWAVVSITPGV